jgi:hypothetical protein
MHHQAPHYAKGIFQRPATCSTAQPMRRRHHSLRGQSLGLNPKSNNVIRF